MKQKIRSGDASLGAMSIDWQNKKIDWFGIDGCGETCGKEVIEYSEEEEKKGRDVWYLIYWKDQDQLCVHDRSGFIEEVFKDEEADEEEDD